MSAGVSMAPRFATVLNDGSLMSRAIGLCHYNVDFAKMKHSGFFTRASISVVGKRRS